MNLKQYTLAALLALTQLNACTIPQEIPQKYAKKDTVKSTKPKAKRSQWINSQPIDIQTHDKVILLDFWLPSCKPCVKAFPKINEYTKIYENELTIVGVVPSRHEDAPILYIERCMKEKGLTFPNYVDNGPLHEQFNIQAYPTYVLIDQNKKWNKIRFENIESELEKIIHK